MYRFSIIYLYLIFVFCLFSFFSANGQTNKPLSPQDQEQVKELLNNADNFLSQNNKNEASRNINLAAYFYWEKGHYKEAITQFERSIALNQEIGNTNGVASIYNNIGMIYGDLRKYEDSYQYFEKSLNLRIEQKDKQNIASAYINMATAKTSQGKHTEAIPLLEQSLEIVKELKNIKLIRNNYLMLAESYEKAGNPEKSMEYFNFYTSFDKLIQKEEIQKKEEAAKQEISKIASQKSQVEAEVKAKKEELENKEKALQEAEAITMEKQMQIDLLNKEKAIKELESQAKQALLDNQLLWRNSLLLGFLLVAVLAFVLYRGYRRNKENNLQLVSQNKQIHLKQVELIVKRESIKRKNHAMEEALALIRDQNHKITSSINYAQRIQQAMLPSESDLQDLLPESFILFKPRDHVSGDFYWFIGNNNKNKVWADGSNIAITAADCTGHGVPGALMSMIGYNHLEEISFRGINEPDQILNELHKGVRKALKQEQSENRDGMDMALCLIDRKAKEIRFAGAKNPMIYIQNNEMFEIKGDTVPIGGIQKEQERIFTKHRVSIEQPTWVYLFSDGYVDQFGGPEGRKFMSRRFKELIMEIYQKPMDEQKHILDEAIENWKGEKNKQIDDILVIGFKV
jgi:serine phosphatase RsbU (regulator of sigma subunit)